MDSRTLTDVQVESLRDGLTAGSRFHPQALVADACMNEHHRGASCALCADSCPMGAIRLHLGAPQLDSEQCICCGLCGAACPVEAWRQDSGPERTLVEVARGLPDAAVAFVCALHPQPAQSATPVTTVVRQRRCLAALDLGDLLDAYGLPPALHLTSSAALKPLGRTFSVVDGGQPKLSRRRFFAAVGRARSNTGQATLTARRRLLAALPHIEEGADVMLPDRVPFGKIEVDPARCSACGLCAYLCPTDALVWSVTDPPEHDDAAFFTFGFDATACIDCPICMLACPEDAIRRVKGVTAAALQNKSCASPLVSGRLVACVTCGALSAEVAGAPRCHVCRHAPAPVTSLQDGAGLMADLLGRIPSKIGAAAHINRTHPLIDPEDTHDV